MQIRLHNGPEISRNHDVLLILGDGRSMPDDMATFLEWKIPHDVGCIGRCIKAYPRPVQHWFNADGETAIHWAKNLPNGNGTIKHTLGEMDGFDVDWEMTQNDYHHSEMTGEKLVTRAHGSSALFATLAGLAMGYKKVILGGCPMDTEGHWYFEQDFKMPETFGPMWPGYDFMAWLDFKEQSEAGMVRSLSGYTAKILGIATWQWMNKGETSECP